MMKLKSMNEKDKQNSWEINFHYYFIQETK